MKKYVVKDTIINLETLESQVYYTGKDGYVYDKAEWTDGYSAIRFALASIKRNMEGFTKINDIHCLESNKWLHHYEVIEIEQ